MDRNEVLKILTEICSDVFEVDDLKLTFETTAADIEEWDSLTHLSLINEVEMEYGIKFTMVEIQNLKNVGDLVDTIIKHA